MLGLLERCRAEALQPQLLSEQSILLNQLSNPAHRPQVVVRQEKQGNVADDTVK